MCDAQLHRKVEGTNPFTMAEQAEEGATVRVGKRVFVGNLAWRTSWQDLKDRFRESGNVVYSNVMKDEEGRSKGWGIVEYETPEEALVAIQTLNGADMGGRRILVREDREDRDIKGDGANGAPAPRAPRPERAERPAGGRGAGGRGAGGPPAGGRGRGRGAPEQAGESSGLQIVVQGIPWAYTWQEVKDMFADIGDVERAEVAIGRDGRSRGFATVRFTNAEAAQSGIAKWHDQELEGRRLLVFLDKFA